MTEKEERKALERLLVDRQLHSVAEQVLSSSGRLAELYELTGHADTAVAWHALWACERICRKHPSFFIGRQHEMIEKAMRAPDEPPAIQAICIKLACKLCGQDKDLLNEFKACLINMNQEFCAPAVRAARKNTLKSIELQSKKNTNKPKNNV